MNTSIISSDRSASPIPFADSSKPSIPSSATEKTREVVAKASLSAGGDGKLTSDVWLLHHVEKHDDGDQLCYLLPPRLDPLYPGNDVTMASNVCERALMRLSPAVEPHPQRLRYLGYLIRNSAIKDWEENSVEFVEGLTRQLVETLGQDTKELNIFSDFFLSNLMKAYDSDMTKEENVQVIKEKILGQLKRQKQDFFPPDLMGDSEDGHGLFENLGFSYGFDTHIHRWVLKTPNRSLLEKRWSHYVKDHPEMPELTFAPSEGIAGHVEFATAHVKCDRLIADKKQALHDMINHVHTLLTGLYLSFL